MFKMLMLKILFNMFLSLYSAFQRIVNILGPKIILTKHHLVQKPGKMVASKSRFK